MLNARRFGIWFARNKWFSLPKRIWINNREQVLSHPGEIGVTNDFLACMIWNDYGLRVNLPAPKTIVDIGANIGLFSLAARGTYSNARIHAYEPNPRAVPYLRENTKGLDIEIFDEAVGSTDGFVSIDDQGDSNQATTQSKENGSIRQVALSTVISRIAGPIDLLKLDCEGAEWELFNAGECWNSIRHLRMEYHLGNSHTFAEVATTLRRLGFGITRHRPNTNFGLVWASRLSGGE